MCLGGLKGFISWTPFSDVLLVPGRAFLEQQTENLVYSPTTHQSPSETQEYFLYPGKAIAQCAIIPDDIIKVLEI